MQAKIKCAVYTRVSTDNQREVKFNSCEAQEAKIKSFIKSQENMEIYKTYTDAGFTGANINRPALTQMLSDVQNKKVNLVISYKIDRLTRSPKDFYGLVELFEKHSVDFLSVTERFDTSTPSGRLLRNIMLTFAQFERELASERTKDKLFERAKKGMWNGGIVPFGYKSANKKLIISKKEATTVKNIYDQYISSGSLSKIYDTHKSRCSKSSIHYILRNIIYTGKIKYDNKIYQGKQEPIIAEEIFNRAQMIHKNRNRTLRLYKSYSLGGLLKCDECDTLMTPCHTNKRTGNKLHRYYYYRCTNTFKKEWTSCDIKQVNANRLEKYIFKNLERISLDKHYLDSLMFKLNNSVSSYRAGHEPQTECLERDPDVFQKGLQIFINGLSKRKDTDKNLWVKEFIKEIKYSKDEITISLFYKKDFIEEEHARPDSVRSAADAVRPSSVGQNKKIPSAGTCRGNHSKWLLG